MDDESNRLGKEVNFLLPKRLQENDLIYYQLSYRHFFYQDLWFLRNFQITLLHPSLRYLKILDLQHVWINSITWSLFFLNIFQVCMWCRVEYNIQALQTWKLMPYTCWISIRSCFKEWHLSGHRKNNRQRQNQRSVSFTTIEKVTRCERVA